MKRWSFWFRVHLSLNLISSLYRHSRQESVAAGNYCNPLRLTAYRWNCRRRNCPSHTADNSKTCSWNFLRFLPCDRENSGNFGLKNMYDRYLSSWCSFVWAQQNGSVPWLMETEPFYFLSIPPVQECRGADFDGEGRFVLNSTELLLHQTVLNFSAVTDLRTSVAGRCARELYVLSLCRTVNILGYSAR